MVDRDRGSNVLWTAKKIQGGRERKRERQTDIQTDKDTESTFKRRKTCFIQKIPEAMSFT